MVFYFQGTRVEETHSDNISKDKGTVIFECEPEDGTPFAVTIERRGDEYINTAKGLVSDKVEEPEKFEEALKERAKEILDN